jgi:hypothetical protein
MNRRSKILNRESLIEDQRSIRVHLVHPRLTKQHSEEEKEAGKGEEMRIENKGSARLRTINESGKQFADELLRLFHNDGLFLEADQPGEDVS